MVWPLGRTRNPYFMVLGASLWFYNRVLMLLLHRGYGIFGFHPISPIFTHFHLFSLRGWFPVVKGKAQRDSEETWSFMGCWTALFPLLGGDAQAHAAIVAMYIPLLGTPSCPQTSFATCYGVADWGQGVLHYVGWASTHEGSCWADQTA